MKTLLLDTQTWDLVLDARGSIAIADDPYAVAQSVASAIKLFSGELYYDTSKGVPYFAQVLGQQPPPQIVKALLVDAALTVPGVVSAVCYLSGVVGRRLTGQVVVTTRSGAILPVGF